MVGLVPRQVQHSLTRKIQLLLFKFVKFRAALTGPYALEPWYFGQLTREQSDALLNSRGIEGDFLVRDSESNVSAFFKNQK